eukprot:COSAG06_NODE_33764_length_484_cov_1.462338_2_plen_50_part_01
MWRDCSAAVGARSYWWWMSVKGLALGNAPNFSADLAVHAGSDITGASITG